MIGCWDNAEVVRCVMVACHRVERETRLEPATPLTLKHNQPTLVSVTSLMEE